jgi:hypothetical protein
VAAELGGVLVGAEHDRERVPADDRADLVLDLAVARMHRLPVDLYGVEVRGVRRIGNARPLATRALHDARQEEMRPFRALHLENAVKRFQPFLRLERIGVADVVHGPSLNRPAALR